MTDTKFPKRLIKKKKYIYIYNELKNILTFFEKNIPNTIPSSTQHPATPQSEIKSQYRVFSQKNPNTKHFNALTH